MIGDVPGLLVDVSAGFLGATELDAARRRGDLNSLTGRCADLASG